MAQPPDYGAATCIRLVYMPHFFKNLDIIVMLGLYGKHENY
jgi:hypothetical protein